MAGTKKISKDRGQFLSWLTVFALLVLVFHLLMLWYRWLRPNPDFLDFTAGVVEILAIVSFLGLQTEIGQRFVLRIDDTFFFKKFLNTPSRISAFTVSAAILAALAVYVGSPIAAVAYSTRG